MDHPEENSLSTDIKSDISFMNRQKELRNLYREFRTALESVNSLSISHVEEEQEEEELYEQIDDTPNNLDMIIQEIIILETETSEILSLISKKSLIKNPRVKSIRKQIEFVKGVIGGLKERAINLKR